MFKYSEKLRKRTIDYFAKTYDHHINDETADLYLESFATLFLAFVKTKDEIKKE